MVARWESARSACHVLVGCRSVAAEMLESHSVINAIESSVLLHPNNVPPWTCIPHGTMKDHGGAQCAPAHPRRVGRRRGEHGWAPWPTAAPATASLLGAAALTERAETPASSLTDTRLRTACVSKVSV